MRATLPQDDPHPTTRQAALDRARDHYVFDNSYHGMVALASVPLHEKADARWWGEAAVALAKLEANKLATKAAGGPRAGLEGYADAYSLIRTPSIVSSWRRDDVFAWQALAGANPVMLRRMTAPLPHFPVTAAQYARTAEPGDSLDRALAEGRLYLADYRVLDGLPEGELGGMKKYGFAPIALYAWQPGRRELVAIAIQTGQSPGQAPLFTPQDGVSWRMARTCVMTAEGNYQGILSHFALCHQVMESVVVAARRQLSERHPILVLLGPHFENTLVTNEIAKKSLIGAGGNMERLQSPTLEASLGLARRVLAEFRLTESAPPEDFRARGVDDVTALPDYPARDDALLSWAATAPFVDAYTRLYYASDAAVAADTELAAWVDELGRPEGGGLSGIARPRTVDEVAALVSRIVFRCTTYHASINYSSFDLFSYAPNMQTAAFGPGPRGGPGDTEAAFEAMIPPYDCAYEAISLFYQIGEIQLSRLGQYPSGHFDDPRVADLLAAYNARLEQAEQAIEQKNATRKLAYPFMLPSRVPLSIHV